MNGNGMEQRNLDDDEMKEVSTEEFKIALLQFAGILALAIIVVGALVYVANWWLEGR